MPIVGTTTLFTNPTTKDTTSGAGYGGLGPNGIITPDAIRLFLCDIADENVLNDNEIEFGPILIEQAVTMACSVWNSIAPFVYDAKMDGSNWPTGLPHILLLGASAHVLRHVAACQIRNQYSAQDGGVQNIGMHDKYSQFMQFSTQMWSEFRDDAFRVKQVWDIDGANIWSSSPLEYAGRTYGDYGTFVGRY